MVKIENPHASIKPTNNGGYAVDPLFNSFRAASIGHCEFHWDVDPYLFRAPIQRR